jgi:ABC-type multidrug transport system ATPase subunit
MLMTPFLSDLLVGAGKTTTINILTGAVAPSSGYAVVAGKDIRTQIGEIREDIGICLQHDCLFPELTVRQHIQFFSRLKGLYSKVSFEEAEAQVDQAIQDVALSEKRNTLSKNLSGGMKRKLSVAMAFCGGSKVVLLDEPTSGMVGRDTVEDARRGVRYYLLILFFVVAQDPFSRRFTWNVIRHYRQDRCIILTTHFMVRRSCI